MGDLGAGRRACDVDGVDRASAGGFVCCRRAFEAQAIGVQRPRGQRALAHALNVRRVHERLAHERWVVGGVAAHAVFQRLAHRLLFGVVGQALVGRSAGGVWAHESGLLGLKNAGRACSHPVSQRRMVAAVAVMSITTGWGQPGRRCLLLPLSSQIGGWLTTAKPESIGI